MNRSKQKGTAGETAVVQALVELGWPHAERRALSGIADKGDVAGVAGVCIEVKAEKAYDISGWLKETETEKANANASVGACWFKIRGRTDPMHWGVVMTGAQFVQLLKEAGYQ